MNQKLKDVFKGKVVNKALTINTGVDEFPCYVVEYLTIKAAQPPRRSQVGPRVRPGLLNSVA